MFNTNKIILFTFIFTTFASLTLKAETQEFESIERKISEYQDLETDILEQRGYDAVSFSRINHLSLNDMEVVFDYLTDSTFDTDLKENEKNLVLDCIENSECLLFHSFLSFGTDLQAIYSSAVNSDAEISYFYLYSTKRKAITDVFYHFTDIGKEALDESEILESIEDVAAKSRSKAYASKHQDVSTSVPELINTDKKFKELTTYITNPRHDSKLTTDQLEDISSCFNSDTCKLYTYDLNSSYHSGYNITTYYVFYDTQSKETLVIEQFIYGE